MNDNEYLSLTSICPSLCEIAMFNACMRIGSDSTRASLTHLDEKHYTPLDDTNDDNLPDLALSAPTSNRVLLFDRPIPSLTNNKQSAFNLHNLENRRDKKHKFLRVYDRVLWQLFVF